jgi:hypothetical protein
MKRNTVLAEMLAVVLAFAPAACGGVAMDGAESFTFRFRVENKSTATITKVEFFNGSNENARILRTFSSINLTSNALSNEYRVSGFTDAYGTDERFCAARVTYEDGDSVFAYGHFGPESKILVASQNDYWTGKREIKLSQGTW